MKILLVVLVTIIISTSGTFYLSAYSESNQPMMSQNGMGGMKNMCQTIMNSIPQDVIIKTISSQMVSVGEESTVTLLVVDKETGNPM
ncbi:MAG: hypothetical protein ACE5R7_07690, partial [Nitrosarchaeum sp.]